VLGRYEDAYNRFVHGAFWSPVGWYALLPLCVGWVLFRGARLLRSGHLAERGAGALLYFCLIQIGYMVAVTALLTWGENARYRYIVEPLIWLVGARTVADLVGYVRVVLRRLGLSIMARYSKRHNTPGDEQGSALRLRARWPGG
jgi:hypothetical protein